jgi:hypothetical protein
MRFSQAALVAVLAATVASKPIMARTEDAKAMDEYKQCCDARDKHDPTRVCVPPPKKEDDKPKNDGKDNPSKFGPAYIEDIQ